MSKNYKVVTNLTVHHEDHDNRFTITENVKLNKNGLKEMIENCKAYGREYMINKNQITIMAHEFC